MLGINNMHAIEVLIIRLSWNAVHEGYKLKMKSDIAWFYKRKLAWEMRNVMDFVISVPPMIWIQNQLVGAVEGNSLTLECNSEAYPKSINYWTREKGEIVPQGKYFCQSYFFVRNKRKKPESAVTK